MNRPMDTDKRMTPAEETPEEAKQKHNRVLLHALHTAHPVLYQEKQRFIHTLAVQIAGGGVISTVYLTGDSTPIAPDQIQLHVQPT